MFSSTKGLLVAAASSGLAAGALYWWWQRLVLDTFPQCVTGNPPATVDCAHGIQLAGATGFALASVALAIVALIRSVRSRHARVA